MKKPYVLDMLWYKKKSKWKEPRMPYRFQTIYSITSSLVKIFN